jgi:hypothetical protein
VKSPPFSLELPTNRVNEPDSTPPEPVEIITDPELPLEAAPDSNNTSPLPDAPAAELSCTEPLLAEPLDPLTTSTSPPTLPADTPPFSKTEPPTPDLESEEPPSRLTEPEAMLKEPGCSFAPLPLRMLTSPPLLPSPLVKVRVPPTPVEEITSPAFTDVPEPNIALPTPPAIDTEPDSPDSLSPLLSDKDPDPVTDFPLAMLTIPELKAPSADCRDTSPEDCAELSPLRMLTEPPFNEAPCPAATETSEPAAPDPDDRLNMPPVNESELEPTDSFKSPAEP